MFKTRDLTKACKVTDLDIFCVATNSALDRCRHSGMDSFTYGLATALPG